MLVPQELVRVLLQYLVDVGRIVLAAKRQDESPLLVVEDPALKIHVGIARIVGTQGDAVDAVLP